MPPPANRVDPGSVGRCRLRRPASSVRGAYEHMTKYGCIVGALGSKSAAMNARATVERWSSWRHRHAARPDGRAHGAPSGATEGAAPDEPAVPADPAAAARFAGLRYVSDLRPGIRRTAPAAASLHSPTGERIKDPERLRWLRSLAIPPAWTDVWISPFTNGHILATGRDKRGRKQYRYHPSWREVRDETKYARMIAFGELLPRIRRRVDRDLARRGMAREKVLAAVVRLLELTLIRVGNEEYARVNTSFGLTTLRNRHVRVRGTRVRFRFRGKGGVQHEVGIRDRRLAAVIGRLQDLPGQELFEYSDASCRPAGHVGRRQRLPARCGDARTSPPRISGRGRVPCWHSARCARSAPAASAGRSEANVVAVVKARRRPARQYARGLPQGYVHPAVLEAYVEGTLVEREAAPIAADVAGVRRRRAGRVEVPPARTRHGRRSARDAADPGGSRAGRARHLSGWADPAEERAVLELPATTRLLGSATAAARRLGGLRSRRRSRVAILATIFGAIGQQAGRILTTVLGWASTLLFGRVPQNRQLLLALVTLGSLVWVAMVARRRRSQHRDLPAGRRPGTVVRARNAGSGWRCFRGRRHAAASSGSAGSFSSTRRAAAGAAPASPRSCAAIRSPSCWPSSSSSSPSSGSRARCDRSRSVGPTRTFRSSCGPAATTRWSPTSRMPSTRRASRSTGGAAPKVLSMPAHLVAARRRWRASAHSCPTT